MSFGIACFAASTFDQSDWLKLLGLAGAVVALYLFARRPGGRDESLSPPIDRPALTQLPSSHAELAESQAGHANEGEDSDEPDDLEQPTTAEEEVQPRNIQIRDWNFAKFEIKAGPPNVNDFVDELLVNLFDKSTGQAWNQTYLVATPAGLEKMLHSSRSNFMFLPQTLVMNRYDVNQLRKAVLGDLGALEEERGEVPPDARDTTPMAQ
jgi:hypothetical protein